MIIYSPELWTDFFVACAGAAAALAGLMIVALSVSVKEIIRRPAIPAQAGATLGILALTLLTCVVTLLPHQATPVLGIEILIFGILGWLLQVQAHRQLAKDKPEGFTSSILLGIFVAGQAQVLPFVIGGLLLMFENGAGMYWTATGIIVAFGLSLLSAWVWLIEVRR